MTPLSAPSGATRSDLPHEAYAAALAYLPGMGPARLAALLLDDTPTATWYAVLAGDVRRPDKGSGGFPRQSDGPDHGDGRRDGVAGGRRRGWAEVAAGRDVDAGWRGMRAGGITVAYIGGPGFPAPLACDPEPPGVVFWRGDLPGLLHARRVAVIGTRRCTGYGRDVARTFGRDLAACGVCVVSGLALGIDGAAHEGALGAGAVVGPLGVAASGVDRPYPLRHTELWRQVASTGALLSETPPGCPAQAWRFPARNRLIAALSEAVVVVESQLAGGSMLTVAAAADRGIDVLAVPGPVTSASSFGTNQLLYEGSAPVRHAGDVLAALGDLRPWPTTPGGRRPGDPAPDVRPVALDPVARRVLEAIDRTPTATSAIAERTRLPFGALSAVLLHLEGRTLVRGQGTWWERCDRR